ncbi:glycoside hydrolase family 5 protein [Nocardia huaxiensis]|uniref:Cellulase family glycosylhydrolase n=1 Tax=Nocardia huaxiensis TaxID=2755382 RepID=A0A7D6V9P1_9NOCA|nr:cellulase family glycosylhydrolase [Nocardia huaxiensis]QLY29751.1 cellulase family glycosylhydrolase [Nocardia huaxiensis]UFS96663.1 glycoside hydrolase family 5 protein [Nocardia huaxiensis]
MTLTRARFRGRRTWHALAILTAVAGAIIAPNIHLTPAAQAEPAGLHGPLSTRGRYIVDADGNRVKLQSANWHGSSGTWQGSGDDEDPANNFAQETGHRAPLGLDRVPMDKIINDFRGLGINSVRLPFSNEMITDTRPVQGLTANPTLNGLKPLEVYDRAVTALTDAGLAVILNNHTTSTLWCCAVDGNERWNSGQTTEEWIDDWVFMTARYQGNSGVIGADLRNEVRRDTWHNPNWGWGDGNDFEDAVQWAGDRILKDGNPNLLIMIEGLNWQGIPTDLTDHERPMLKPMRTLTPTLVRSHKIVYAAHFYGYIGPNHTGADGWGETTDPRFRDMSRADLFTSMDELAGFVAGTADRHFTAPVWISEFGVGKDAGAADKTWFVNLIDWLIERDLDFAYWPMVGFQKGDKGNQWALLRYDTDGSLRSVLDPDDWRGAQLRRLVDAKGYTGQVAPVRTWSALNAEHRDHNASLRAANDWDPGAHKAVCPDDQRLIGISSGDHRGLCTDATQGDLWQAGTTAMVVKTENVTTDWASGFTKYQCAEGQFMIGYSLRGDGMSAVLCAPGRIPLAGAGRTVWDDKWDNRPASGEGGDYAEGFYKAQCNADEYAAGIGFSRVWYRGGHPDALYCRKL